MTTMRSDHRTPPPTRTTRHTARAGTAIGALAVAAIAAGILVWGAAPAVAADTTAGPRNPSSSSSSSAERLTTLGDLVLERLRLATPVAEYKWLHGTPIADPAREQAVIDEVTATAERRGIDPERVVSVVRAQIAASKLVQRGLFTRWTHDPWSAPTTAPDIAPLRQQITDIDDAIVDAVGATADVAADPRCAHAVVAERHRGDVGLDPVARRGLHLAWTGFCRS